MGGAGPGGTVCTYINGMPQIDRIIITHEYEYTQLSSGNFSDLRDAMVTWLGLVRRHCKSAEM